MAEAKFKIGDEVVIVKGYADGSDKDFTDNLIGECFTIENVVEWRSVGWSPSGFCYNLGYDVSQLIGEEMLALASEYNSSNKDQ